MKITPTVGKARRSVELAKQPINLWEGSVRSSKTINSLAAWLEFVVAGPAGNLAMIGKTERTLRRNVIDPLIEILGPKLCKANWGDGELWLLGRKVYLAGANNEAAVGKIQGLTLTGAYVDEVTLMPESMWSMLLTRLSVDGARLYGTCNPDSKNHWLMKKFLARARVWLRHDGTVTISRDPDALDLARFSFNLADNPSLPAAYVDGLSKQFTGLWKKRYVDGLWVLAEGAIYDTFDPEPGGPHVVTSLPDMEEWAMGIDYGTVNPFVALLVGLGVDERIYMVREWRWDSKLKGRQLTDAQYSQELTDWLRGLHADLGVRPHITNTYVDPSAASFIIQLYKDGWQGVSGADNTVLDGIRNVASLLAADRLKFHHSCEAAIDEHAGYVWDPKAAIQGEEKPLKEDDHAPDAGRYTVMGTRRWWRWWLTDQPTDEAA